MSKVYGYTYLQNYQLGKLYEVCDVSNKNHTSWLYWSSNKTLEMLNVGDVVVFLGSKINSMNQFISMKLLISNGWIAHVTNTGNLYLKPL